MIDLDSLLPPDLFSGFAGCLRVSSERREISIVAAHSKDSMIWRSPTLVIGARAEGERAESFGWDVYCHGEASRAEEIAKILGEADFETANASRPISQQICRQLGWALLPRTVTVAVHRATGAIVLLRDGWGFTCLYYCIRDDILVFSSCLAALRSVISATSINTDKLTEMFLFGHRGGNRTVWQEVNVVAPGYLVFVRPGERPRCESLAFPECLFDEAERRRLEQQSVADTLAELDLALKASLESVRNSDRVAVPCGGGVDSSLLGAYLASQGRKVKFWSINQPEAERREADWIKPLSQSLGVPCQLVNLDRERFLSRLIETLHRTQHPAASPGSIGGVLAHVQAREDGERVFVSGEGCDTVLGGLSAFNYLSPRFRLLQLLSRLPSRLRLWLRRGLTEFSVCCHEINQVVHDEQRAMIGAGILDRGAMHLEVQSFRYVGQSTTQRMADLLTFSELKRVPATLHHSFHEKNESFGGRIIFPFAHPALVRLGIHIPHYLKRRHGHNKWLWRKFAAAYVGKEVAFRRKYAFPTLTDKWLDRASSLLTRGFLETFLCTRVDFIYSNCHLGGPTRWTLINLELWGRLHVWREEPRALLNQLL